MKTVLIAASFAAGALVAGIVNAQSPSEGAIAIRQGNNGTPVIYDHASTLEEGVLRGWADLYRGAGDYNYSTSLANINNQQAYSLALDNSVKRAQAYFARREVNRQAKLQQHQRPSAEDIARFASERAPERLAKYEYSATLGDLNWPAILNDSAYTTEREALDALFADRSLEDSGLGSANHRQIEQVSKRMAAMLKSRIRDYSPSEYSAAKSFLKRLERESLEQVSPATGLAFK
ncbi:MAG: hypothetical protein RIC55_25455 [Pirellulaceae bacterium]